MRAFLREHTWPVLASVSLHGLLAVGLVLVAYLSNRQPPASVQPLPIDAVVVSSQVLHAAQQARTDRADQEMARQRAVADAQAAAAQAKQDAEARAAEQAEEANRTAAAARALEDAQRQADATQAVQAKQAADARKAAEARHVVEIKLAADARHAAGVKQALADQQAADAKRAADAKQAADAKRDADAKQAADAKRAAEAKQAADAKRAADERARQEREAELRRQITDEEHVNAVESGPLRDQYVALLRARIQGAWIKPPSARPGVDCLVEVTQIRGGEVTGVRVVQCNGDDAVRQSIQNAVYRASPLPDPPDPALFERVFQFRFKPNE